MVGIVLFFFFKQKTAYEMRISDLSSDVCSSDLGGHGRLVQLHQRGSQARTHAGTVVDGGDRLRDDRRGLALLVAARSSAKSRVGNECASTCRSRGAPVPSQIPL